MKPLLLKKYLLTAVSTATLALSLSASGAVTYTFDTDLSGFTGTGIWTPGPSGSASGGAIQTTFPAAGWTGLNLTKNFDWASGDQPAIQTMVASGGGRVSFDILVDGSSFTPGVSDWYQAQLAANSENGWQQMQLNLVSGWHDQADTALYSTHIELTFAQLGWTTGATWFQLNFGANSGSSPVHYYVDNLTVEVVPEPSTFALAGLGSIALCFFRRRR
ncbi:MAG: PEP-CTERM sorting domain-containing protein [Akkermansiaceae bacterium]|nr:PEP-CTERM sorting domain-containing protein [Verrucomicrobiales bacterium]